MKRVKECVEKFRTHIRWSQEEGYAIVSLDVDLAAEILAQRDELAAQRDALLAACKALYYALDRQVAWIPDLDDLGQYQEMLHAAIARAEPEGEEATE